MQEYENILEELKAQRELNIRDAIKWFEFVTVFNSNDFNYFLEFLKLRSDDMKGYMRIAANILGFDKVEGQESTIFKFFLKNLTNNAKAYHLTNSVYKDNIKEKGLGFEFKANKDFDDFYSSLNETTKNELFNLKERDDKSWCFMAWPELDIVNYGDCPEWFFFLSGSGFSLKKSGADDLELSINWLIKKFTTHGESKENIEKGINLLKKYWPIFANGHKILVTAPLLKIYPDYAPWFDYDNWLDIFSKKNVPYEMALKIVLNQLSYGIDLRSRVSVSPEDLDFFDMKNYELIKDNTLKK